MPYLSTDRACRYDASPPAERDSPLVLTRWVGSSQVVERCSPEARRLGLRPGMTLGQAQAMAPRLRVRPDEPSRDRRFLARLADWALRFSPIVEPVEPDALLVDVTGCERLFGGEDRIAAQAVDGLRRQGVRARAAIADTVGAAWALATAGDQPASVAPPGHASAWLASLPPSALRIGPKTHEQLYALGVRSIGDLLMLPRELLPARFGPELPRRLAQALGEIHEPVAAHRPEQVAVERVRFETCVTENTHVQEAAGKLLAALVAQVVRQGQALRRLDCVLTFERVAAVRVVVRLSRGSQRVKHVEELLRRRLEVVDCSPGVIGILLSASETLAWRAAQAELFDARPAEQADALACLIDRIANRLGHDAVARVELIDDYQPELAYRYVSFVDGRSPPGAAAVAQAARVVSHPARPLRLLPRPIVVRAIAIFPDGPPTWLSYRGREHVVAAASGPERIETGWWRRQDVRRDYFRVTSETGEQFWVFRSLDDGGWYVHGVFS
ncbi:MAG: Protein ImuB [Phycisphaerae bacterium]|nr:Protein ImuB [Phycisphaerae bacterium]